MLQNLALSGAILLTLVPLAATGVLGLATVVLAHELAEVVVIANGVRAGRRRHAPLVRTGRAAEGSATTVRIPRIGQSPLRGPRPSREQLASDGDGVPTSVRLP